MHEPEVLGHGQLQEQPAVVRHEGHAEAPRSGSAWRCETSRPATSTRPDAAAPDRPRRAASSSCRRRSGRAGRPPRRARRRGRRRGSTCSEPVPGGHTGRSSRPVAHVAAADPVAVAEVGLGDLRVAPDRLRRAGGDDHAEVQHDDPVARGEHHVDVVLDQQQAEAAVGQAADLLAELLPLGRVEPGGRLVEQRDHG